MRISCILLFALGNLHSKADAANLRCYDGSFENFTVFCLSDPVPLLNSRCYDPNKGTLFYTFGFNGLATGPSVEAIVPASLNKNIVLVDWENEASEGMLGRYLGYLRAVINAKKVGILFGQALIKLIEGGLSPLETVLIGFSLGASLMGYAAREFQTSGQNITRVVGLDPAGPLFDGPVSLQGLDASSATLVTILHTNPGGLGTVENGGTVDIRPNCGGMGIQPGCDDDSDETGLFSQKNRCSHDRSWQIFAEALKYPNAFKARRATSCDTWNAEGDTIFISDNIDLSTSGVFYLNTNSEPLYGKGEAGSIPDSQE